MLLGLQLDAWRSNAASSVPGKVWAAVGGLVLSPWRKPRLLRKLASGFSGDWRGRVMQTGWPCVLVGARSDSPGQAPVMAEELSVVVSLKFWKFGRLWSVRRLRWGELVL